MVMEILVYSGSGNGTEPLPESMLIYHQWDKFFVSDFKLI